MQKKQLINPAASHPGFEKDGESGSARVEESSLSHEEPALQSAAAVSNLAVLLQHQQSLASPSPSLSLKRHINIAPLAV